MIQDDCEDQKRKKKEAEGGKLAEKSVKYISADSFLIAIFQFNNVIYQMNSSWLILNFSQKKYMYKKILRIYPSNPIVLCPEPFEFLLHYEQGNLKDIVCILNFMVLKNNWTLILSG